MLNDLMQWLESEVQRLTHLRDRASDLGKKKQYPLLLIFFGSASAFSSLLNIIENHCGLELHI